MADSERAISELSTASVINNSDNIELSQDTGNGKVSLKATILAVATKMLTAINFTSALTTTDKTVLGAINEVAQGGGGGGTDVIADDFDSTATYAVGDYCIYNGSLYKCTTAVTTAGDWDSSDWTETLVMDEVEQGGGGGTGGHTIIDENGTSMTARAGLQFVGGANVSDDSTNNKTIVDLASAGGIDGVFIDTDNVIQTLTYYSISSPINYTATEDCIVVIYAQNVSNLGAEYRINDIPIYYLKSNSTSTSISETFFILLKKGQTLTSVLSASAGSNSNYTVYGIQTGTTHSKFQPVIYSTEEREIGVWTDGKPLYQKTVVLASSMSITSNTWTDIDNGDWSFVDTFVLGLMVNANGASVGFVAIDKNTNNNKLRVLQTRSTDITCKSVTIQYTKLTDTAGSGDWTPSGIPSVHYSTEEQVVGTWLGETLYEKVLEISALSNDSEVEYNPNISNFGEFITCLCSSYIIFSSGNTSPLPYFKASSSTSFTGAVSIQYNANGKVAIKTTADRTNCSAKCVLRYIKASS